MIHRIMYGKIDLIWDDEAGTITSILLPDYAKGLEAATKEQFKVGMIMSSPSCPWIIRLKRNPLKHSPEFLASFSGGSSAREMELAGWKLPPTLNWDMVMPLIEMLPESAFDPDVIY